MPSAPEPTQKPAATGDEQAVQRLKQAHAKIVGELRKLIVGMDRWTYRVFAYAALLTDAYPPFRLDE